MSGQPRDAKKVSETGPNRLRDVKTKGLYGSCETRGFVKAAVIRYD